MSHTQISHVCTFFYLLVMHGLGRSKVIIWPPRSNTDITAASTLLLFVAFIYLLPSNIWDDGNSRIHEERENNFEINLDLNSQCNFPPPPVWKKNLQKMQQ